jgi:hypothetical protein
MSSMIDDDRNTTPEGGANLGDDHLDAMINTALAPRPAPSGLALRILNVARDDARGAREKVLDGAMRARWMMPIGAAAMLLVFAGFGTAELLIDPVAVAGLDLSGLFDIDVISEQL